VAVLDTGIDAQHADFAGRIGATKDFSGKGSVEDGHGHGTHVASIVAGSGAASDGKYNRGATTRRAARQQHTGRHLLRDPPVHCRTEQAPPVFAAGVIGEVECPSRVQRWRCAAAARWDGIAALRR
jgi:subtilisin family serine protease